MVCLRLRLPGRLLMFCFLFSLNLIQVCLFLIFGFFFYSVCAILDCVFVCMTLWSFYMHYGIVLLPSNGDLTEASSTRACQSESTGQPAWRRSKEWTSWRKDRVWASVCQKCVVCPASRRRTWVRFSNSAHANYAKVTRPPSIYTIRRTFSTNHTKLHDAGMTNYMFFLFSMHSAKNATDRMQSVAAADRLNYFARRERRWRRRKRRTQTLDSNCIITCSDIRCWDLCRRTLITFWTLHYITLHTLIFSRWCIVVPVQ